jgi:hypothetical protein
MDRFSETSPLQNRQPIPLSACPSRKITATAISTPSSETISSPTDPHARTGWLLLISLLVTFAASKAILYDTLDPDSFWHLRVAEQLQRTGIGPIIDNLSFMSQKTPWTPYSWLAELAMKRIWNLGGFRAAIATQSLLIGGIFALIALAATTRGGSRIAVAITTFTAAYLSLPYLSFRPATAALTLFALAVWLIIRDRAHDERTRTIWLLVPLTILMVNVHLFAVVVPLSISALLAGAICERRGGAPRRHSFAASKSAPAGRPLRGDAIRCSRYAVLLALTTAACCATPMLPGLIASMWHFQTGDAMVSGPGIAELRPFYSGPMGWLSASLVAGGYLACWKGRSRLRPGDWFWLIGGTLLLFRMGRFSPLFVIIAAPIVAAAMPNMAGAILGKPAIRLALASLLCIGLARIITGFPAANASIDIWLNRNGPDTPGYPCGAAAFVQSNIHPTNGRILNDFTWGGYLDWRLGPTYQTLMDGRTQCFAPTFWRQTCMGSPIDLQHFLEPLSADAAIVPKDKGSLRAAVIAMKWKRVYTDDRAEVFVPPSTTLADTND